MSTAPRDGTMVRLLVQFTNHGVNDGFDSGPAWTIGANTYDDSGDDEWFIAGWDWQQDCFTAGEGEPLGWLPMLSAPATDEREIAAYREALEKIAPYPKSPEWELDYPTCRRIARAALEQGDRLRAGTDSDPGRTVKPHRSGGGLRPSESDSGHMGIATEPSVADRLRAGKENK